MSKWEIVEVEKDEVMSIVRVKDNTTKKKHDIRIEHIRIGNKYLDGTTADKDSDHIITDKVVPKYIRDKALEAVKLKE